MPKVPCPRCGNPASPNARGPDYVHCRRCGGLVPACGSAEDDGPYSDDPVASAIARERGLDEVGVRRRGSNGLLGGL